MLDLERKVIPGGEGRVQEPWVGWYGGGGVQGQTTFGESYWEIHGGFNCNNFLDFLASKQFHSVSLQGVTLCA